MIRQLRLSNSGRSGSPPAPAPGGRGRLVGFIQALSDGMTVLGIR